LSFGVKSEDFLKRTDGHTEQQSTSDPGLLGLELTFRLGREHLRERGGAHGQMDEYTLPSVIKTMTNEMSDDCSDDCSE
jgi:hypothetical protein